MASIVITNFDFELELDLILRFKRHFCTKNWLENAFFCRETKNSNLTPYFRQEITENILLEIFAFFFYFWTFWAHSTSILLYFPTIFRPKSEKYVQKYLKCINFGVYFIWRLTKGQILAVGRFVKFGGDLIWRIGKF